jgi:hypothetical protein
VLCSPNKEHTFMRLTHLKAQGYIMHITVRTYNQECLNTFTFKFCHKVPTIWLQSVLPCSEAYHHPRVFQVLQVITSHSHIHSSHDFSSYFCSLTILYLCIILHLTMSFHFVLHNLWPYAVCKSVLDSVTV